MKTPPLVLASAPAKNAPARLAFLDAARCLAIGLMIFAHVTDVLVSRAEWQGGFGRLYLHLRGLTAPLFFLISGWAFSVGTLPRLSEHKRLSPVVWARLRRAGVLVFWGSALTLPWWAEGFPWHAAREVWLPFLSFGVLHCIAASLLLALLFARVSPSPGTFAALSLGMAVIAVASAPFVQGWALGLPAHLRGALYAGSFSGGFPLTPWVGYFFFGGFIGSLAWLRRARGYALAGWLAALSIPLIALGLALAAPCRAWLGEALWPASPSLALQRLGTVSLLVSALALVVTRGSSLAQAASIPSAHALTFYVGHMLILWGVPFIAGLQHRIGARLSFAAAGVVTVGCLVLLGGLIAAARRLSSWMKQRRSASPPRAEPEELSWSAQLLQALHICVSPRRLTVNGRAYPLDRNASVEADAKGPRLLAALVVFGLGVVGIPGAVIFNRVTAADYSWLIGFPMAFFLCAGFRILTAETKYRVVLRSEEGEVSIFKSGDHQAVIQLVAALREALAHAAHATSEDSAR